MLEEFKSELKDLFLKHKIHSLYPDVAKSIHYIGTDLKGDFVVNGIMFVCIGDNRNFQVKE